MQHNVIQYLWKTAEKFPDKTAVDDTEEQISFIELKESACKIAGQIETIGVKNKPIGVYIPKSAKAVQAFAGISLSGNFYVPLDTKSPDNRITTILDDLDPAAVVTDFAHYEHLQQICKCTVWVIEEMLKEEVTEKSLESYLNGPIDTDPVYTIFTSGSTGKPKGVVISHRGVTDYIDWAIDTFHITENSTIGNQAPFYFDNSTLDIYLMYATGATLVIVPEMLFAFPADLVDFVNKKKISFVFWVPSVLINVANMDILETKKPEYLKSVFFAGEVMPNKHLNYWRRHLPDCRYVNLYGPTEITVDCTYYVVEREFSDDEPLPIGFPCRNSDVLILTDRKRLAKQGEQGELCVRGSSLALGYYNHPEKTEASFIQNPLHSHYPETIYCTGDIVYENELGEIMYVGRGDAQIKHNGYRIELGEIEQAVLGTQLADNCCAVYDQVHKMIMLFYQAKTDVRSLDFRKALSTRIPKYMLPSSFTRVEEIKTNHNGKTDRMYYQQLINQQEK